MSKILLKRILQKISLSLLWCSLFTATAVQALEKPIVTRKTKTGKLLKKRATITGKVSDAAGKPLIDVLVQVKGKPASTQTDLDGKYSLNAETGDILVFSVASYETQTVTLTTQLEVNVTLLEAIDLSPSQFNVPYLPIQRKTNTGSIGEIRTAELTKTTTAAISGTIAGRLAGLAAFQISGEPGGDAIGLNLRGQSPLILFDGVPQSFASINPEQIASITIMKDAVSTAMLGVRSSGNVINITTRKGAEGAQRIAFTAMAGFQQALKLPKFLNAYNYATLYNEALANDGKAPVFAQADLDAYRNGSDPIGHPDVDWLGEILKKNAPYSRYDLSISGGRKVARYFVNLDYLNQQGLIKTADFNAYNTGSNYKRYIFRTNVDVDLSNSVNAFLNVFTRIQNQNQAGSSPSALFSAFRTTPNNAYNVLNDNGSLGGNRDYTNNIYGQSVYSGYVPTNVRDFRVDLGIKGKLDWLTPGLYVNARTAINAYLAETITRTKAFATFQQSTNALGAKVYQQFSNAGTMSNGIDITSQNKRFYSELSAGYQRKFNNHNVSGLLMASLDNFMDNSRLPSDLQGISGRGSYNYAEKYMIDAAFGYNGSQAYPKNNRYGFFPAVGLGWNLKKEDFLKNRVRWISSLKLRASYGKTGNNNAGYFEYNKYYVSGSGYNFGETVTGVGGVQEGAINNPFITWEKALKFNVGIDAGLFADRLSVTADYFSDKYYDLLQTIGSNSQILGNTFPRVNIGKQRYSGIELQLNYSGRIGDFNYGIAPNFSTLQSKVVFQDEVQRKYAYMQRTGAPVGQTYGLTADGLFQNTQEIAQSALPVGITPKPGDIKYRDLNGDGTIDENDISAIGGTKPVLYYGLNLTANYFGFDLSALFQGVGNRNTYLSGNSYWEFQGSGKEQAYEHHLNRWTPATAATASYPRLSIGQNLNNQQVSSYWLRASGYVRLKSIELGYSLPSNFTRKIKLNGARFFVNGYNLFTSTALDGFDPESSFGGYPIQKMLTAGVNIKL